MFFGVKKVGIIAFLVSADNSASVDKMTNIMYGRDVFFGWVQVG